MAKKKAVPTKHSAVQRDLKTPKYRMRVVEDKRLFTYPCGLGAIGSPP